MRQRGPGQPSSSGFYPLALVWTALIGICCLPPSAGVPPDGRLASVLIGFRLAVEVVAGFYVVATLLKCLDYLISAPGSPAPESGASPASPPRVAVVYLCCDDLDVEAFRSLCRLEYSGPLEIVVHDDGREDPEAASARIRSLAAAHGRSVRLLRRPRREGGKPGAVNHVLGRIEGRFDFLLFCDNDSIALDPHAIEKGLRYFVDPSVAAVQFRGRGVADPKDSPLRRRLARAIDVFDVFARHQARHGMMPFLGHNALVRDAALREAGGLTPGCLSDDIDVSVRWYLSGHRVLYARDVEFAERAPASYAAFRLRARKWAFGCAQVIRRVGWSALLSGRLSFTQKLGFAEFIGFYAVQVSLVAYLVDTHILIPLLSPVAGAGTPLAAAGWIGGALVLIAILMPTLAFCLMEGSILEWPSLAWTCCLVYGSAGFETCRGLIGGLARKTLEWAPTNGAVRDRRLPARCWFEFLFGLGLFLIPLRRMPALLSMPVTYLFVANYLFSPIILACYRDVPRRGRAGTRRSIEAGALPMVLLAILATLAAACLATSDLFAAEVEVRGREVRVDGRAFLLKGIHYSPWLPGTGPGKGYPWPDAGVVGRDLDMIRSLNANAVLVYDDAPEELYDEAGSRGLMVLQAFSIDWQRIADKAYVEARRASILRRVDAAKHKPNLLAWVIGNEVTEWVYEKQGPAAIAGRLEDLARDVRASDPAHPITHANWPVTKELPVPFADVVSFNVYPLWPREVAVRGYEEYLRDVLRPRAGGRPLWVTEFGLNTLESTPQRQAETLAKCWAAIRRQTAGGIVFSFTDEWWKNYDNPIESGKYWQRAAAPDDEKAHDLDPEEYYGLVDENRLPKPAFEAVARMYREDRTVPAAVYFATPLVVLMAYTVYVFTRRT